MEIPFKLPTDTSGFLRRECPTCQREFKWFAGATSERPDDFIDPPTYFCPYCGVPSPRDTWWTPTQLEYARRAAAGPIMQHVQEEMEQAFGRGGTRLADVPESPNPLVEPDDMVMIEPPCHSFEPLKIVDNWDDVLHCLMCGYRFRM